MQSEYTWVKIALNNVDLDVSIVKLDYILEKLIWLFYVFWQKKRQHIFPYKILSLLYLLCTTVTLKCD